MTWLHALILGITEGLTEFVPVSSTGHLILVNRLLGLAGEGASTFAIVIQLGALFSAVIYYRRLLCQMAAGLLRGEATARHLVLCLGIASLPALCLGYLLGSRIKALLFGPFPVALALCAGGALMIIMDRVQRRRARLIENMGAISMRQAALVGLVQAFALWPGTSRSMACIVGGQLAGLSTAAAADFAFLLAIPVLGTATVYDLIKNSRVLLRDTGSLELALGLLVSFLVGWLVIAAFLRYLRRFGLAAFGYYRIVLGALVVWLL